MHSRCYLFIHTDGKRKSVYFGGTRTGSSAPGTGANTYFWVERGQWVKNGPVIDWSPGQPNNGGKGEACMEFQKDFNYLWNDYPCAEREQSSGPIGTVCESMSIPTKPSTTTTTRPPPPPPPKTTTR